MPARMRLFQLVSPSLPTGAFTYSQGLEWAVGAGRITDQTTLTQWLESLLFSNFKELEIPLLKRLYDAAQQEDLDEFARWASLAISSRETSELREEEKNRGRAMARLLKELEQDLDGEWQQVIRTCQLAGFALAAAKWQISCKEMLLGYTWGWLENMVMAAVKIVPLGQTTGQQVLAQLSPFAAEMVEQGMLVGDDELAGSCPLLALASGLHETQYTRLFRS